MSQTLCDFLASKNMVLEAGGHSGTQELCALEAESLRRGLAKTDDPVTLNTWDHRLLNDINVPATLRTEWMCKVADSYRDCRDWPIAKQRQVVARIAIMTVQRLLSKLPGLSNEIQSQCRAVTTLAEALEAAKAAEVTGEAAVWAAEATVEAEEAEVVEWAAEAALEAAEAVEAVVWAVETAGEAAETTEAVFVTACQVWIDAASKGRTCTTEKKV